MYDKALSIDPENVPVRYRKNDTLLKMGHLRRAWEDFDVRFPHFDPERLLQWSAQIQKWDGTFDKSKRILFWTEQGIGEQILALRSFSDFVGAGGQCIIECPDRLVSIFKRSFPDIEFVTESERDAYLSDTSKPIDFQAPALNLLSLYAGSMDEIPAQDHPQTQGKIERWHQTLKNRILLENYFLPGDLKAKIGRFVAYYNHHRYHESLSNLTPADVYFGRGETILLERERIKQNTINQRRLQHRKTAA